MALWQIEFYAIDKDKDIECDFDDVVLWKRDISRTAENISFLPKDIGLSDSIIQFGRSDESCIEILKDENDKIQEISIRLDLRTISNKMIDAVVDYLNYLDSDIYYDGKIYNVSKDTLKSIIATSDAYRFCKEPVVYFKKYKAYIEYCIDGYNVIRKDITNLEQQLDDIREETKDIFTSSFGVDIVIDGIGRISIGIAQKTIVCYKSDDFDIQLTAVGDINIGGETSFYFGDYSLMSNKYLIPYELGLKIIKNWISTGELLDEVKWTNEVF